MLAVLCTVVRHHTASYVAELPLKLGLARLGGLLLTPNGGVDSLTATTSSIAECGH